jgi:hypothetical protein
MIQNVLTRIGGIENYGVLSVVLFVAVFAGVLGWAATRRTAWLEAARRLPLEGDGVEDANPELLNRSKPESGHE